MIDIQPPSTDPDIAEPGCSVAAARIVRWLHETAEWQRIIDEVIELFAKSLGCHRGILFRLRELPGEGLAQSIAAYWEDSIVVAGAARPQVIVQSVVNADPLLGRLAEEVRQGKMFAGRTREIDGYLRQEFEQTSRADWPLSIAFCDLDGFKKVNDTYGHQAGDSVLKATAELLRQNVRRVDVVARYGGEEFILVFPSTDRDVVRQVCERIVAAFRTTRHDIAPQPVPVTVSIGYATHDTTQRFASVEALVRAADQALYTAKLQGRNRTVRYEASERVPVVQFL